VESSQNFGTNLFQRFLGVNEMNDAGYLEVNLFLKFLDFQGKSQDFNLSLKSYTWI